MKKLLRLFRFRRKKARKRKEKPIDALKELKRIAELAGRVC